MNIVHFDTSRLTPLGWTLFIASWGTLIGLFVLIPLGAPKVALIVCLIVYFGSLAVTAILDYAGDAIHRPKPRVESVSDG